MVQARPIKREKFERPLVIALCAAFILAQSQAYFHMDAKLFWFFGLKIKNLGLFWTGIGFLMAWVPSWWLPIRLKRPSQVAYWILYLTVIVPVMWIPLHTLQQPPEDYLRFSLTLLACFFGLGFSFRFSRWKVPRPDLSQASFLFGVGVVALACTLAIWSTNGFHLDFGLKNLYVRRRSSGDSIPMGSVLSYVKGNLGSALQPYTFAAGLARGSMLLIAISIFAGVVGFSVDGSKTSAMIPFFLLMLLPLITKYRNWFGIVVPGLAALSVFSVLALWQKTNAVGLPVVTTWRLFDVKGLLSGYYWEYFSTHPKMYLSDGILRAFFDNPYQYAAPEQIGYVYFGSAQTNSNANVWASSFGDFGFAGMIVVTIVLSQIFRLIDSMALNRGFLIPAFLSSFLGMKLSDVALDTSILSHGTLAIIVLIYFLPPLRKSREATSVPLEPAGAPA